MRPSARRAVPAALAVLAAAVPFAGSASASPATERADAALDRALDALVARPQGPPGAISLIQRGDDATIHAAGVADRKLRRQLQVTDHMRLASTSKAFSGAVALALVSRGKLSLATTIGARLPGRGFPNAWRAVTLGQLLHHTSGLPDYTTDAEFLSELGDDLTQQFDSRGLWTYVDLKPLRFVPGTAYHYSNTDNIVVALMAEAATGRTYETLLADLVYTPLRLTGTSLPQGFLLPRTFIHGYLFDPSPTVPQDISEAVGMSGVWASGGMVSTPADLAAFARGYVGARLFSRAVQRRQMSWVAGTSEPPGPGVNSAGLAIFRYRTRCGTVYGHTGNFPGYTQFFAATPDGRRSVTVSVNEQLSQAAQQPKVWRVLRAAEETAVCAALAR